jgi:hypothetical protein
MPSYDPTRLPKHFDDVIALHFGQSPDRVGCVRLSESPQVVNWRSEDAAGGKNDSSLDNVLQLADVPWPVVFLQQSHDLIRNGVDLFSDSLRRTLNESFNQRWNILTAVPQWGDVQRKHAETIVEIGSKLSSLDHSQ